MPGQEQFLEVIDRDEAERRFHAALRLGPLGEEMVELDQALGRVLSRDVLADVDVPCFDRSNYDGYAVRAADTYGAREELPRRLELLGETISTGSVPVGQVHSGQAMAIATGGMLPRGADAVVMVEYAEAADGELLVARAVTQGFGVSFAGTDIGAGEIVLRRGVRLTSRETGVLAAVGVPRVAVWRRPRVAVISTGDEIVAPGEAMRPGLVFDSNARILADAIRELGGEPLDCGIVPDDAQRLRAALGEALAAADVVLLSGGTSKGAGDLCYRVVQEVTRPGIVAHGVALKPGKPICLAVHGSQPIVVLPGFPTSAIFTFHEFVAPLIRIYAGLGPEPPAAVDARLAVQVNSEIGRTEYLLVGLVEGENGLSAWPMGQGSGSVTTFSRADGFVTIDRHQEIVEEGAAVRVQLLAGRLRAADLVAIGSHCVGLDYLLGQLQDRGFQTKFLSVGSTAGLEAASRGQCDLAGIHLLDPATGQYNRPFLTLELELIAGYARQQGLLYRPGDARFENLTPEEAIQRVLGDPDCVMVNRNQGSGTRILIDRLLAGKRPPGYAVQARNHNAVAAAIVQRRADWGVAIEWVARHNCLGFLPLAYEHYDFVVPRSRADRPALLAFRSFLADPDIRQALTSLGFRVQGSGFTTKDARRVQD